MDITTCPVEDFARQNCAAILHRQAAQPTSGSHRKPPERPRSYECKTCGQTFASTQALGGHRRESHKDVTLTENSGGGSPGKGSTVRECRVCGLRFPTGRTLGGHMRKHSRAVKRKRGDEDGGEEAKKKRVETGSLDGSEMVMRGVLLFDLNLPPADQETVVAGL